MSTQDEHARMRRQLAVYYVGLLDETETARVGRHLADCAACRTILEGLDHDETLANTDEHIPAFMVATWPDQISKRLSGLERQLMRDHLNSCASCQDDLRAMDHEPVLPFVARLELGSESAPASPDAFARIREWFKSVGEVERWQQYGLAAAAVFAVAIGVQVFRGNPNTSPTVQVPQGSGGGTMRSGPAPAGETPNSHGNETSTRDQREQQSSPSTTKTSSAEVMLVPTTRGRTGARPCTHIDANTQVLYVSIPASDVSMTADPASAAVLVGRVSEAQGQRVWARATNCYDDKKKAFRVQGESPLRPGFYDVYFISAARETLSAYRVEFCETH